MSEIQTLSEKNDFKKLTYYFASPNLAPTNFIGFRRPLNIYNEIKNANTSIKKQKKIKINLSPI